jgi:hypothetical protein
MPRRNIALRIKQPDMQRFGNCRDKHKANRSGTIRTRANQIHFGGVEEVKIHEAELLGRKLRAAIAAQEDLADTHEKLGYGAIAREARAIANAYRARLITVSQLAGSTFQPADKSES